MPESWSSSRVDLYLEVAPGGRRSGLESALRAAIREGRLTTGTLLPSTRGLAAELGLSRGTVTAAYDQLAEEGYLTIRPGSGTRVADLPPQSPPAILDADDHTPLHDLRSGWPDVSAFPTRAWLAATRRVLNRNTRDVFGIGDPQGRIELRRALAEYLGRARGVRTSPDQIIVTSGYYQGVGLLSRVLREGGIKTAACEDPGHDAYRGAVERELRIEALPVDSEGAQIEMIGQAGAVFLTPSHQYPTGVPLHPKRRQAVCAWARTTGGLVIEDDYDGEFRYDRQPIGALQGIAPEHVVYGGSASKTLSPVLRLGWLAVPQHLVPPLLTAKEETDFYTEALGQLVLAELITSHAYDRHIRASRLRYRRRRQLLLDRLAAFPELTVHGVPAGLSTLVTGLNEPKALAKCAERGIALRGLTDLYHNPTASPGGLIIGFAAPSERQYPATLNALCNVLP
ncbi:MocR-like pyridoxine biosynthesis transcription factor PdxR [Actinomadura rudentiformis]|uniref:PLP-dependent aminotransferase family protein n=1 Tax=Actinomadura rudentiformis TaxID=359158 RepID=A0A6H9YRB7_9ACTN|nr:PLP-dependent aminotransferase family protein [Actinomadura rudentiformis]KAB2344293.1 PLP-dependent aminotransferase family protein [Actinomadura rudentiformis]